MLIPFPGRHENSESAPDDYEVFLQECAADYEHRAKFHRHMARGSRLIGAASVGVAMSGWPLVGTNAALLGLILEVGAPILAIQSFEDARDEVRIAGENREKAAQYAAELALYHDPTSGEG
jgi:hypothetical protein